MNYNYIIIKGINKEEIDSALSNLVKEYDNYNEFGSLKLFEYNLSNNQFIIRFESEPDFKRFSYVVNFLKYPIGPEYTNADIKGYYSLKEELPLSEISDERLMLYIPNDSTDYFSVYIVTDTNKSFTFNWDSGDEKFEIINNQQLFDEPDLIYNEEKEVKRYFFNKLKKSSKSGCITVLTMLLTCTVFLMLMI